MQAAKQPHKDISDQEAERAVRLSEHLLYIQRQQRALLKRGAEAFAYLSAFVSASQGFQPALENEVFRHWKVDQVCSLLCPFRSQTSFIFCTSHSSIYEILQQKAMSKKI